MGEFLKHAGEATFYLACIMGGALIMVGGHRRVINKLRRHSR